MQFTKMHGAGNDYVYVNGFDQQLPSDLSLLAQRISHRRFGVGSDGLILILPSDHADARMRMFNADGSESEMCGNGIRCVAKYVYDHGIAKKENLKIETGAGTLALKLFPKGNLVHQVQVNMGAPKLSANEIPCTLDTEKAEILDFPWHIADRDLIITCVSMGNPHCIVFVTKLTDELVLSVGPQIEQATIFPKRTNVEFVEVISRSEVRQRTWERGSGETWACGTGASAVCVAGVLTGRTDHRIVNHLVGGDLTLEWKGRGEPVFMTGPAVEVFTGIWNVPEC